MPLPPELIPRAENAGQTENLDVAGKHAHHDNEQASCEQLPNTSAATQMPEFVSESIYAVQQKTSCCRQNVGLLLSTLIRKSVVSNQHYLDGVMKLVKNFQDNPSASPVVWANLAESIVPVISTEMVRFSELHKIAGPPLNASRLLSEVLELIINEKGHDWIESRWDVIGVRWTDFLGAPIKDFNKLTVSSEAEDKSQVTDTLSAKP